MAEPRELHVGVTSFAECRRTFQQVALLFQEQFGSNEEPIGVGTHSVSLIGSPQQDAIDKAVVIDSGNITSGKYPRFTGDGRTVIERTIEGSEVVLARIDDPTFSTVQHLQDVFHSAGWISGGTITDGGSDTVDGSAGAGAIRSAATATSELLFFDWAAETGLSVPSGTTRFIGIEYNAGSPRFAVKSNHSDFDFFTDFVLATVVNEAGGAMHIQREEHAVGDHAAMMILRLYATLPLARDRRQGGLIIGETGTRNVTMSAGSIWEKLNVFPIAAIDTSGSDTFDAYYRDGAGGWTLVAAQSQWPNTEWDDNSGTLQTMTNNRYASLWFYIELDDEMVMLYPQAEHSNLASAEAEGAPATLPPRLVAHGKLIGRIVFQKSAGTATSIESVFETMFAASAVTDHSALNLDDGANPHGTALADLTDVTGDELRTISKIWYLENPVAGLEFPLHFLPYAATMVEVHGVTDTGTMTFNIERRAKTTPDVTGTDVIDSGTAEDPDLLIDATGEATTSFAASGAVAADQWLVGVVVAVASGPTKAWVAWEATID